MEHYRFNKISDILEAIKEKNYDRNFISLLGSSYEADEATIGIYNFEFNENNLREYSFLFHFFNVVQVEYSSEYFRNIMEEIVLLDSSKISPVEIKKILYRSQLAELENKFKKKLISEEVFKKITDNFLG